jgi:hypothetical protein
MTGLVWLRIETRGEPCKCGNEPLRSIKCWSTSPLLGHKHSTNNRETVLRVKICCGYGARAV